MSLFPTKSRLRLLRDVADSMVWFSPHDNAVRNRATTPASNVLSATAEQRHAGWITVDIRDGADTLGHYPYRPTGTGWNLLAKHLPDGGPIPPVWLAAGHGRGHQRHHPPLGEHERRGDGLMFALFVSSPS